MREHRSRFASIVEAMENQCVPSVRRPLDPRECLRLCLHQSRATINDLCMIAVLRAASGDPSGAAATCERVESLSASAVAWDIAKVRFCRELSRAIRLAEEQEFICRPFASK